MITIKISYECTECGAGKYQARVCGNDNVFDLLYGAFGIVNKNRVKLTAENECENCGHLQEFKLGLIAVEKEN